MDQYQFFPNTPMNQIVHQFDQEPAAQEGHLRLIGARLWRRRRLFGLIFTLFLVLALAAFLIWPAQYQTTGMVIVGNLDPFNSASAAGNDKLGDPADLESQILIAKSPDDASRA